MRGTLWFQGDVMFILVQQFSNVSLHCNVEGASSIIPIELDSTIKIPPAQSLVRLYFVLMHAIK